MITGGIDSGAKNVKAVIMKDGRIIGRAIANAGLDTKAAVKKTYDEALYEAGVQKDNVQRVFATGFGRKEADFADGEITVINADAKGALFILPSARTLIDIGAEESRAIRMNNKGEIIDFSVNERCAAGAGTFIEAMARALEIQVEKITDLYEQSSNEVGINTHCVVFAESELVSLVHSKIARPDIVRAVISGMADRIVTMMRRVGIENDVAAIGGVALNKGFIKAIEKELNIHVTVPSEAQYISAIGAAMAAAE